MNYIVSCNYDGNTRCHNPSTGVSELTFDAGVDMYEQYPVQISSTRFLSASNSHACVWDVTEPTSKRVVTGFRSLPFHGSAFLPAGGLVAIGESNGPILVFRDDESFEVVSRLIGHESMRSSKNAYVLGMEHSVVYSPTELITFSPRQVWVWDVNRGECVKKKSDAKKWANSIHQPIALSNEYGLLFVAGVCNQRCALGLDLRTWKRSWRAEPVYDHSHTHSIAYRPGHHQVIISTNPSQIHVFDVRRPVNVVHKWEAHESDLMTFKCCDGGPEDLIVTTGSGTTHQVRAWKERGEEIQLLWEMTTGSCRCFCGLMPFCSDFDARNARLVGPLCSARRSLVSYRFRVGRTCLDQRFREKISETGVSVIELACADIDAWLEQQSEQREEEEEYSRVIVQAYEEKQKEFEVTVKPIVERLSQQLNQERDVMVLQLESIPTFVEKPRDETTTYRFSMRATGLDKKDLFGLSDPYVRIYSKDQPQTELFRSAIIKKSLDPNWGEINHPLTAPSLLHPDQVFIVKLFDWNRILKDDYLGHITFCLAEVLDKTPPFEFCVVNEKKRGRDKSAGTFLFESFEKVFETKTEENPEYNQVKAAIDELEQAIQDLERS